MYVTIKSFDILDNQCRVDFETQYGRAIGIWIGEPPIVDAEYSVEIDFDNILTFNESVKAQSNPATEIGTSDGVTTISGILESVDEDGYSVLRLGVSIIPFMMRGFSGSVNIWVQIATSEPPKLTPY